MNKKIFKYAFMLVVVTLGIVSLTACGGSDDGDDSGSIPSALVGTWNGTNGSYTSSVTFNSNGTFTHTLDRTSGMTQQYAGTYTISGSTITCTGKMVRVDSDGEVTTGDRTITFIYSNGSLSGGAYTTMTYTKQGGSSSSSSSSSESLVGWYYAPKEAGVLLQNGSSFQLSPVSFSDEGAILANRYKEIVHITSSTSMDVYTEVYQFTNSNSGATWANKWTSYSVSIGTVKASSSTAKKTYTYTKGSDRLSTSNGEYMILSNGVIQKNGSSYKLTKQ